MTSLKRIALLCAFLPMIAFAQVPSYTPNIQLQIPGYGQTNWQIPMNYNFNLLDRLLSGNSTLPALNVTGPAIFPQLQTWQSGTTYSAGQIVVYLGTFYASLSNGNVGNLPTNLSFWTTSIGSGSSPTGAANLAFLTPNGTSGPAALRAILPNDLPVATNTSLGVVQPDNATISQSGGILSVVRGSGADTRPSATTSAVGVTVAAGASCLISVSPVTAGQQSVGACATGTAAGPGTITHIHLTLGPAGDKANITQNSTVTFNCDGTAQTVPLSLFFLTQDSPTPFSTDWNEDALGGLSGNFSGNRRMEFNFSTGCQVTFNNASATSSTVLFGEVDYRLGPPVSRPRRNYWHVFTQPLTSVAQYANFQMLPTVRDNSGGELESVTLFGSSPSSSRFLEGYTTVTVDGNAAKQANGTEDFFGSGFYAVNSVGGHVSPKWGEFYSQSVATALGGTVFSLQSPAQAYDALLFRNFQTDDRENVLFNSNLAVFQPNGEATKPGAGPPGVVNMESMVTFWTQDPMVQTPTFSPAAGAVSSGTTVTMSSATAGAINCYTTDGTTPAANGAGTCTHGTTGTSLSVTPPVTLQALASRAGFADSFISSASYTSNVSASYTFSTSVFAATGATSTAVITTPAATLSAGDFVFLLCQQGVPHTGSWTVSDSNGGNTWHSLALLAGSGVNAGASQGFYILGANAGSTTFTCTQSTAGTFSEAVAMVYHTSGATPSLVAGTDISAASVCGTGTSCTSSAFSTTTPSLVIYCGIINNNGNWVAGNIGGTTATLRAAGGSGFSGVNPACEDAQFASSQTSITSAITSGVSASWNVVGAAFH